MTKKKQASKPKPKPKPKPATSEPVDTASSNGLGESIDEDTDPGEVPQAWERGGYFETSPDESE